MAIILGCIIGFIFWFLTRYLVARIFTADQKNRYSYPQVRVIPPARPGFQIAVGNNP